MIWSTATSLLIHNTGLPEAVLWSFLWVLSGLCIGWVLIVFHMQQMERAAMKLVEKKVANGDVPFDLLEQVNKAKGEIAAAKTWRERLFSLKAAHGILMSISYSNIVGRVLVTQVVQDFHCYTYPVYKPLGPYTNQTQINFVPGIDPLYSRLPWSKTGMAGWAIALLLGPLLAASIIGAVWSVIVSHKAAQNESQATRQLTFG